MQNLFCIAVKFSVVVLLKLPIVLRAVQMKYYGSIEWFVEIIAEELKGVTPHELRLAVQQTTIVGRVLYV